MEKPYGLWDSPLSAEALSGRRRLNTIQWDSDGATLLWHENRSGRGALVAQPAGEAPMDLMGDINVRGGILYGGGEFSVRDGVVIFVGANGCLYRRTLNAGVPRPITPAYGRLAAPALSPDLNWVAYIFSDGQTDLLAAVDSQGREWPLQLSRGADFYMQPAWSPDGKRLAWVEWDNPNMPWDDTRLMLAEVGGSPLHIAEQRILAGGEGGNHVQPEFSPDGRWLAYAASHGEWEALYLFDLTSGQTRRLLEGEGLTLSTPAWVQGRRTFGWAPDSQSLFYLAAAESRVTVHQVELQTGASRQLDAGPYTWLDMLNVSARGELACVASAPSIPDRIVRRSREGNWITAARSGVEDIPAAYMPRFEQVEWPGMDGQKVYGVYSPPTNPNFNAPGLPPAIVNVHGGPSAQAFIEYSADAAYFTSRGWAWLEVNYRGSTGFGRSYRLALNERWGDLDVQDTVSAAQFLQDRGLADGNRLVVRGGSAGGYTALNALVQYPGRFKAGISLYGIGDMFTLVQDSDKFEARYQDTLVGVLPADAKRYFDWSPAFHADRIREPLAIFQGDQDTSVPASQAEAIVAALRANGVPHVYRLYPGEGHGFRKPETIRDMLQTVESFLQKYVLFAA